jgi:hypothetical protein
MIKKNQSFKFAFKLGTSNFLKQKNHKKFLRIEYFFFLKYKNFYEIPKHEIFKNIRNFRKKKEKKHLKSFNDGVLVELF